MTEHINRHKRSTELMDRQHAIPAYRILEQNAADTYKRRSTRQTNPPEIRAQENGRNAASMATRHTEPSYRM
jgi:hypothetical protein